MGIFNHIIQNILGLVGEGLRLYFFSCVAVEIQQLFKRLFSSIKCFYVFLLESSRVTVLEI